MRFPFRRERRPKPPSQVTALDIDGSTLRVVQAGAGGRVTRVLAAPLDVPTDADRSDGAVLGAAVARALAGLGLQPGLVVMGVPRARVVLRTLILPAGENAGELAALVYFQAAKDLPFRMDEAVIDFQVCGLVPSTSPPESVAEPGAAVIPVTPAEASPPRFEVLVAAVKSGEIEFHQRLATAAGFKLAGLGLLPVANARCIEVCQPDDGPDASALVTLRADEVGIDVVAGRSLRFSRGATLRPGTDPAASAGAAVIEVVRSLHAYSGNGAHPAVARVLVAGATGQEAELLALLAARLESPCALFEPAVAFGLPPESAAIAAGSLGAIGLASAVGSNAGLPVDFLKPKRPPIQRDHRRLQIILGVAAALVLLGAVLGLRALLIQRRTAVLTAVTAELADADKKRPTYRRMVQQATVVDEWVKGSRDWLDHVAYLTSILPPSEELYITSLTISLQGGLRLAVQARSGETLARLEKQLRSAGYDIRPIAISPGADRFGYEFRSTVELTIPDRLKIDLHKVKPPARPLDDMSLEPAAYRRSGV